MKKKHINKNNDNKGGNDYVVRRQKRSKSKNCNGFS